VHDPYKYRHTLPFEIDKHTSQHGAAVAAQGFKEAGGARRRISAFQRV